jgi:hypothetical protein
MVNTINIKKTSRVEAAKILIAQRADRFQSRYTLIPYTPTNRLLDLISRWHSKWQRHEERRSRSIILQAGSRSGEMEIVILHLYHCDERSGSNGWQKHIYLHSAPAIGNAIVMWEPAKIMSRHSSYSNSRPLTRVLDRVIRLNTMV